MEEIAKAECGICTEPLSRKTIILTNPCGHMLCTACCTQLSKVWKEGCTGRKRCPVCRTILLNHLFAKPSLFNCSRLNNTSLFIWVPTSIFVRHNYGQTLLKCLSQRNFLKVFYYCFHMNISPSKLEKTLAPGWVDYYETRRSNLTCTICTLPIKFEMSFDVRCSHFIAPYAKYI